ncbi:MAG: glutamine amidotransferase [Oscillospiraceae bacterium]|nr:glutamine amidotransferase [Oscillospiraceae bacterium]
MELKICHLYPDVLNHSGDAGNISCLRLRLEKRGIDVQLKKLPLGSSESLLEYDLVFIGGGQQLGQQAMIEDLRRGRAEDIRTAIEEGLVFLCIGGGMEMLGKYTEDTDGRRTDFVGAIDMYTVENKQRLTGDYIFNVEGIGSVVAFENHSGRTYLGDGVEAMGKIEVGKGNNGEDGTEGLRYKNVFGSYGHGPLLPKNPALCDHILKTALERKYGPVELDILDDSLETQAHDFICKRLRG